MCTSIRHLTLLFLIIPHLVFRMVHLQYFPHNRRSAQIIDRQICTSLILIFQEREPLGFARFFVPDEFHEGGFPELGEDGDDVAFGEVER